MFLQRHPSKKRKDGRLCRRCRLSQRQVISVSGQAQGRRRRSRENEGGVNGFQEPGRFCGERTMPRPWGEIWEKIRVAGAEADVSRAVQELPNNDEGEREVVSAEGGRWQGCGRR